MAFVNETKKGEEYKTIDRERDLTLYRKKASGGSSDLIEVFELMWGEEKIIFSTRPKAIKNQGKGDIHHEVLFLEIPENLKKFQPEIKEFITEALDAFGAYWHRDKVDSVLVSFSPELIVN